MDHSLTLTIISPDRILFQGKADSIVLPGALGYFGILPGHASLVSQLDFGLIKTSSAQGHNLVLAIDGGFCEVKDNQVKVLTDGGDTRDDISLSHAEELLQEAEALPDGKEKEILRKKAKVRILLHQS